MATAAAAAAGFQKTCIVRKCMLSPTVCSIHLKLLFEDDEAEEGPSSSSIIRQSRSFSFSPGQWIDFVVPNHTDWVGGFSLVSDPENLPELSLAVRRSNHAPSIWVHDTSRVGSNVEIRVGGSCTLLPASTFSSKEHHQQRTATRPTVFLAGGIGIVPILSMYRARWLAAAAATTRSTTATISESCAASASATSLFYAAKTREELVFADEVASLADCYGNKRRGDRLVLALTQQENWDQDDNLDAERESVVEKGIGRQLMRSFLSTQSVHSIFYLCGPPVMIDDAVEILKGRGVPEAHLKYEKWW